MLFRSADGVTTSSQGASDTTGHRAITSAATASTNVRRSMMGVSLVIYGCLSFHGNASWYLFKEPDLPKARQIPRATVPSQVRPRLVQTPGQVAWECNSSDMGAYPFTRTPVVISLKNQIFPRRVRYNGPQFHHKSGPGQYKQNGRASRREQE